MQNKSNGVCELIADELEQIAGGGCPDGVLNTLSKNAWGLAIAGAASGAFVGGVLGFGAGAVPGAQAGFATGAIGGITKGAFDCITP